MTSASRARRGFSLLEVMVALTVTLVGLLGMMQFQIFGIGANAAGRKHTQATKLAKELAAGMERLSFNDPALLPLGSTGPTAPAGFGRLVVGNTLDPSPALEWSDSSPIAGVRSAAEVGTQFERRWTVWGYSPAAGAPPAVKIVAISVVYREAGFQTPREVLVYTQIHDPAALAANLAANQ
jgi:prepilin-type N-terminal cleavage/methylation domain-containing protein